MDNNKANEFSKNISSAISDKNKVLEEYEVKISLIGDKRPNYQCGFWGNFYVHNDGSLRVEEINNDFPPSKVRILGLAEWLIETFKEKK